MAANPSRPGSEDLQIDYEGSRWRLAANRLQSAVTLTAHQVWPVVGSFRMQKEEEKGKKAIKVPPLFPCLAQGWDGMALKLCIHTLVMLFLLCHQLCVCCFLQIANCIKLRK